jgi:altronate dehydratase large subunit
VNATFLGFPRPKGPAGVRNHVLVIPSVVCSAHVAQQIAAHVPGATAAPHQHGCSQIGRDRDQTARTLAGVGVNPNVYGVVVVGLGCEGVPSGELAEMIAAAGKPVKAFDIQDVGGTAKSVALGVELASELVREAGGQVRQPVPITDLILATECGGSDGWSGVTGNPVIGRAADRMVEAGGTVILAETTELIGAEHLLAARARDAVVAERVVGMVGGMEQRVIAYGADIRGGNPTPGNIEGGISSLEEKSLGCVHKGGTTVVEEVIGYGERPTRKGLVVMDTPGQDIEQITGMLAGGAQVVVFSTGRGSPVGSVAAPVVKVSTNTALYEKMREDMDFDAGVVISEGRTVQGVGDALFERILAVASGEPTCSERLGHAEFAIYRIGPTV